MRPKVDESTVRKLACDRLQKNIVMDDDTMIVGEQVKYWALKLIRHMGETNFKVILRPLETIKLQAVRPRGLIF